MKQALVTGGAGFIGSHMCEALTERGYTVTCLDNFSTGRTENIARLKNLRVVEGDVNDWRTIKQLGRKTYDVAFHYAATVGVKRTEETPSSVLADARGMWHLASLAKKGTIGKIIFASSSEVYGDPQQLPAAEADGIIGWTPYTAVKLYGEHLFAALWQEHHIPTVSLRFFNVYGLRQASSHYGFVVSIFIRQALAGQPLTIYGDGRQTRDFVYVADNVYVTLAAADCASAWGEVINIGSGREVSILDLANIVRQAVGGRQPRLEYLPARTREVKRRCASTVKMTKLARAGCSVPLDEGIQKTLQVGLGSEALNSPRLKLTVQEA